MGAGDRVATAAAAIAAVVAAELAAVVAAELAAVIAAELTAVVAAELTAVASVAAVRVRELNSPPLYSYTEDNRKDERLFHRRPMPGSHQKWL
jgi:hypothetical protein